MEWLGNEYPDLVPRYKEMYARGAYGSSKDKDELTKTVRDIIDKSGGIKPRVPRQRIPRWRAEINKQKAALSTEQMSLL